MSDISKDYEVITTKQKIETVQNTASPASPASPASSSSSASPASPASPASSSSQASSQSEHRDPYRKYVKESYESPVHVFTTIYQGKIVAFVPKMVGNSNVNTKIGDIIEKVRGEWRCNTCAYRSSVLVKYTDAKGKPIWFGKNHDSQTKLQEHIYKECERIIKEYDRGTPLRWGVQILYRNTFFKVKEGVSPSGKPYYHYAYTPAQHTEGKRGTLDLLEKACSKYISLLTNLFRRSKDLNNLRESCISIISLLKKAKYGTQQIKAVEWFIEIIDKILAHNVTNIKNLPFYTRINILVDTIASSPIVEGDSNAAHIGPFHVMNGFIRDILENGATPKAVVQMIEERNNPLNYMRKKGEVKPGHIKAAEQFLRGKGTTILTTKELEKFAHCTKVGNLEGKGVGRNQTSFDSALSDMWLPKQLQSGKNNRMERFAERIRENTIYQCSFSELLSKVKDGKISRISVDTGYCSIMSSVYIAKTDVDPKDLAPHISKLRHLWAFVGQNNHFSSEIYGDTTHVTHIVSIKIPTRTHIVLILENSRRAFEENLETIGNCMLPDFLAAKHHSAKTAVEKLNKRTKPDVPPGTEPLAFGIGTSVVNDNGELMNEVKLKVTFSDGQTRTFNIKTI